MSRLEAKLSSAPTISHISIENFLSFRKLELDFGPLSVLVGPNGAGKTNILKIFQFLGDVARSDLLPAIAAFGGYDDLFFRGIRTDGRKIGGSVKVGLRGIITKHASITAPDEYSLSFSSLPRPDANYVGIRRRETMVLKRTAGKGRRITLAGGQIKFEAVDKAGRRRIPTSLSVQSAATGLATLRRLGEEYDAAQVEELAQVFEQLRLFEIDVERVRKPQRYRYSENLRQDGANIGPFLNYLSKEHPKAFDRIVEDVSFVLPSFEAFIFETVGGNDESIRVTVKERHLSGTTPLARLSFGTIRSIALFAMLHDPNPPRLTCLEEIDHGLHPYALDRLVDRLRDASNSTQLILATHSPALVNRLDASELIVVERSVETGESRVFKQDAARIAELHTATGYELGELWFSGLLGGTL